MFRGTAQADSRSLMNICFVMSEEYKDLEQEFLQYAQQQGMVGIKGHRDVGGFRASCYNAMPLEGVKALVKVMQDFEAEHLK
jgi:phosphoserine aminotransferase